MDIPPELKNLEDKAPRAESAVKLFLKLNAIEIGSTLLVVSTGAFFWYMTRK